MTGHSSRFRCRGNPRVSTVLRRECRTGRLRCRLTRSGAYIDGVLVMHAPNAQTQAPIVLDVTSWFSRATLDVIGQGMHTFRYSFHYRLTLCVFPTAAFDYLSDRDNVLRRVFTGVAYY